MNPYLRQGQAAIGQRGYGAMQRSPYNAIVGAEAAPGMLDKIKAFGEEEGLFGVKNKITLGVALVAAVGFMVYAKK